MIGETVLDFLRSEQFAVDWVKDGIMAITALKSNTYDLVILDLGLPGKNGMQVLHELRSGKFNVPVLITSARDGVLDRIDGLNAGADDYLLKPYDLSELSARIRAVWRRSGGRSEPVYAYKNISINPQTKEVSVDGKPQVLNAKEWALLEALMIRPGVLLSKNQLEEKLYSWKNDVSSNTVEVHIHGLRKKLGNDLIINVRGVGYMIPKY